MNERTGQFYALYLTRFANGFGFITLITLMPEYVNQLDPSGLTLGLFYAGFTIAQTAAVIPLAWLGDRYDKRNVLLWVLVGAIAAYVLFVSVSSSATFVSVRALQGIAVTGSGLMSLALVGELADRGTRGNHIGKANASRFLAGILGSLSAGGLYSAFGFGAVYTVIVVVLAAAFVGVFLLLDEDETVVRGNPFADLAVNRRIITLTSFRAQYAVAVMLVRSWVPLFAGVSAARGGLAYASLAVSVVVVAEKTTNMLCQPYTGRLSDRFGRSLFVFAGGGAYGLVAIAVPFTPAIGSTVGLPETFPILGTLSAAFLPLVALNGLLGVADAFREPASMALFADEGTEDGGVASSFGIRELVWRPGSVGGPLLGGWLTDAVSMASVFWVGAVFAFTGVISFLAMLTFFHGAGALREW